MMVVYKLAQGNRRQAVCVSWAKYIYIYIYPYIYIYINKHIHIYLVGSKQDKLWHELSEQVLMMSSSTINVVYIAEHS